MRLSPNFKWCTALVIAILLFYWKLFFPAQFSFLVGTEETYQAFSWLNFWVRSLHHGTLPIWDPNAIAGYLFPGEMQTSAFNPLNLPVLLFPLSRDGILSPMEYHIVFLFGHVLAALFMFALIRELNLSCFAAFASGLCFSVSGLVGHTIYPDLVDSAVWLPLIFLFVLRGLRQTQVRRIVSYSMIAGLCLGMSVLGGRLHMTIAQAIFVATGLAFHASRQHPPFQQAKWNERPWPRALAMISIVLVTGFCIGAVQLFPSHLYAAHTIRFYGDAAFPSDQKPPYIYTVRSILSPLGVLSMLFPAFANLGEGEIWTPYVGVLPFLMAVIAVVRYWSNVWVKYLVCLTIAVIAYSLGSLSVLHGLLYAFVPYLWIVREATRFEYLANFGLIVLAALGMDLVFCKPATLWPGLNRILFWIILASGIALFLPVMWPNTGNTWVEFSLLMIVSAASLVWYHIANRSRLGNGFQVLILVLIFFDLNAFNWLPYDKIAQDKAGKDEYQTLLSLRGVASFLRKQPQPFRVHIYRDPKPNISDSFGIPSVEGAAATLGRNFVRVMFEFDLLNVRYFIKPSSAGDPHLVYADKDWKVFENPDVFPRAWLVHQTTVEPDDDRLFAAINNKQFNLHQTVLLSSPMKQQLNAAPSSAVESVVMQSFSPNAIRFKVNSGAPAALVVSEIYWPEWHARVDGHETEIYRANGAFRALAVPAGETTVEFVYRPWSFYIGAAVTLLSFLTVLAACIIDRRLSPIPESAFGEAEVSEANVIPA